MPAIQQWWYSRSANPDSPIYVPPEEVHPGTYRLVWNHGFTSPANSDDVPNPYVGENNPLIGQFSIIEYNNPSFPGSPGTGTPLPLSSVVVSVSTVRHSSHFPADTSVYAASTTFIPVPGVYYESTSSSFSGLIYGHRTSGGGCYVLSKEVSELVITATVNGIPAYGELRLHGTPATSDGSDEFMHLSYTRTEPEA